MKKSEQLAINEQVLDFLSDKEDLLHVKAYSYEWRPLRSCSADVCRVSHFFILRSYATIVAIIDTRTDTLYDFLRYVYGYTPTSVQHISKFSKDYGSGKWGCTNRLTYREV